MEQRRLAHPATLPPHPATKKGGDVERSLRLAVSGSGVYYVHPCHPEDMGCCTCTLVKAHD